jgi:hypothetical protein
MDSNKAQQVLFEVLKVLEGSALDRYSLAEVKKDLAIYSVIVRAFLGSATKQQILDIAQRHGLEIKDEKEGLTLYKPAIQ